MIWPFFRDFEELEKFLEVRLHSVVCQLARMGYRHTSTRVVAHRRLDLREKLPQGVNGDPYSKSVTGSARIRIGASRAEKTIAASKTTSPCAPAKSTSVRISDSEKTGYSRSE